MPPLTFWQVLSGRRYLFVFMNRRFLAKFVGVLLLLVLIGVEIGPLIGHSVYAEIIPLNHTSPSVDMSCRQISYSPDGDPFGLCPGPYPQGGNCVWWAWEMWHLLGIDLPRNWGNAADWIADAERSGLPLGKTPRVGSIAVFPIGDGVWAFSSIGHVAFVTAVSADASTFNVTYQNYGDSAPMHVGIDYPVSVINGPRFQNNNMHFIYFPRPIDSHLFERLPGINGNMLAGVTNSNKLLMNSFNSTSNGSAINSTSSSGTSNQVSLGLTPTSTDQEFNADFAGVGVSDLLLYNRIKGSLSVLGLSDEQFRLEKQHLPHTAIEDILAENNALSPQIVSLADSTTPANGWGQSLDIHIGDFTGTGRSEILLYDRVTGKLQLISLTPQLKIQKHVTLQGWGPGWELYVGKFDGHRSTIFMYNRLVNSVASMVLTPTPDSKTRVTKTSLLHFSGSNQGLPIDNDLNASLNGSTTTVVITNVIVVNFDQNFKVLHFQQYTLLDNSWEVYAGSFVSSNQDALFLYDRLLGEARLLSFDANLHIVHYKPVHSIDANWEVYSGDFMGTGRAQVLLYNPSSGEAQILVLKSDLSLADQKSFSGWGTNMALYVGHFGTPTLNVMLYDPQAIQTTFIAFDATLLATHQFTVPAWDNRWQILVGSFLDRSRCLAAHNCSTGDDILVLNRQTGRMEQYVFSFGTQYQVADNRSQGYVRNGVAPVANLTSVDASKFSLLTTLSTSIRAEELY